MSQEEDEGPQHPPTTELGPLPFSTTVYTTVTLQYHLNPTGTSEGEIHDQKGQLQRRSVREFGA